MWPLTLDKPAGLTDTHTVIVPVGFSEFHRSRALRSADFLFKGVA